MLSHSCLGLLAAASETQQYRSSCGRQYYATCMAPRKVRKTQKYHKPTWRPTKTLIINPAPKQTTLKTELSRSIHRATTDRDRDADLRDRLSAAKLLEERECSAVQILQMLRNHNQSKIHFMQRNEEMDRNGSKGSLSGIWGERFAELKDYKRIHGHCNVLLELKGLGQWVNKQRRDYRLRMEGKSFALTTERIKALNSIGFVWDYFSRGGNRLKWSRKYDELVRYKEIHGTCVVPRCDKDNIELGRWVNGQRVQFRNLQDGKRSTLTRERMDLLEAIGFEWHVDQLRNRIEWSQKFDALIRYKEIHGNCLVPRVYKENPGLGIWVNTQRVSYRKVRDGKSTALIRERVEKLEAIGFEWEGRKRSESAWLLRFEELVRYREIHGNCLVPRSYKKNPELGCWVHTQRASHKKLRDGKQTTLTKERVERLEAIGFQWQARAPVC